MEEDKRVVFFTHPGNEHSIKEKQSGVFDWNTNRHARKFLKANGEYISRLSNDQESELHSGDILFWGEWEQPSNYTTINKSNDEMLPRRIHEPISTKNPVWDMLANKDEFEEDLFIETCRTFLGGKQNTDPYVFGDRFMYCCCKQAKTLNNGTISEQVTNDLNRGDIIVFYSYTNEDDYICHIDTVFVVGGLIVKGNYEELWPTLYRSGKITDRYLMSSILPVCYGNQEDLADGKSINDQIANYSLYYGASYYDPVVFDGKKYFSYFPCRKAEEYPQGFARYKHEAFDKHPSTTKEKWRPQYLSINHYNQKGIYDFWQALTDDILANKYMLGIKANEPDIK